MNKQEVKNTKTKNQGNIYWFIDRINIFKSYINNLLYSIKDCMWIGSTGK